MARPLRAVTSFDCNTKAMRQERGSGPVLDGDDLRHFGNLLFHDALNTCLQGEHRHRAASARPHHLYGDDAFIADVDELYVASVHLDRGTNPLQSCLDAFPHAVLLRHGQSPLSTLVPIISLRVDFVKEGSKALPNVNRCADVRPARP